ncbi:MAG: hypothetical protein WCK70_12520 [Chloroflexales bacterium]
MITEPLTVAEATNLAQYEQQIADGMAGFLATGAAMLAIREGRLYRATHRSFADYLEARWPEIGTRRQADRLINAAIVEENVRPIGLTLTSESQARELAQLEPDAQRVAFQQARELAGGKSPTAAQIRTVVRETVAPPVATSDYLAGVSEALRKDDIHAAYAAARAVINNLEERTRAFDAVDARVDGKSIATVLAMLEAPPAPALSDFPPSHVEAGIGAIERRLKDGTQQLTEDISRAEKYRTELDAAREGMQPEIYGKWSARLHSVRAALGVLAAQEKLRCAHCRVPEILIGKLCQICYSLFEAQKWPVGSEDARWRLKQALTAAEAMQDAAIRAGRIAEIRDVAATWEIDLDAPIIESPVVLPAKKSTTTSTATSRTVLLQHAEALLAGLIDKSTAEEQRLLLALFNVGSPVHNDFVADELWRWGKKRIGQGIDLEWIETGVRHTNE